MEMAGKMCPPVPPPLMMTLSSSSILMFAVFVLRKNSNKISFIQFDFLISRQRWHFFCGEYLPTSFEGIECCVLCQNKGTSYRKIPHEALLVSKWRHGELGALLLFVGEGYAATIIGRLFRGAS